MIRRVVRGGSLRALCLQVVTVKHEKHTTFIAMSGGCLQIGSRTAFSSERYSTSHTQGQKYLYRGFRSSLGPRLS